MQTDFGSVLIGEKFPFHTIKNSTSKVENYVDFKSLKTIFKYAVNNFK